MAYRLPPAIALLSSLALAACADDVSSGEGSGTDSSSSTGADTGTSNPSTTGASATGTGSTGDTTSDASTGAADSTGTTGSTDDTTTGESSSGSSGSSSGSTGGETGGVATVCEEGGEAVLLFGIQVPGGDFPNDIPTDLVESCSFTPSLAVGEMPVACDGLDLVFTVESTPMVDLPDVAQAVDVRLHRAPGPLGFPNFWVQLDFADGEQFSFVNSSVLPPPNATVELPYSMALSEQDCGPFNIGTPFQPEDPCGDQMWLGVDLDLDENLTVFHGAYAAGTSGGANVGVWVGSARDYGVLPKTCDFAASFFTTMVVTEAS